MRLPTPVDLLRVADRGTEQARELLELVPRVITLIGRAENMVQRAERLLARAEAVVDGADQARADVEQVVGRAEAVVSRVEGLLGPLEKTVAKSLPVVNEVATSIDVDEVRAMKDLIDRLPAMLTQLEHVGPDVTNILEAVTDMGHAVRGLPGMDLFVRRGERKEDEADD